MIGSDDMTKTFKIIMYVIIIILIAAISILVIFNFNNSADKKEKASDKCVENCDEENTDEPDGTDDNDEPAIVITDPTSNTNSVTIYKRKYTKKSTTVVTPPVVPKVLLSGNVGMTNESDVIYSYYDNGKIVVNGTGDGKMKNFSSLSGISMQIYNYIYYQKVTPLLVPDVIIDDETRTTLPILYFVLNIRTFDQLVDYVMTEPDNGDLTEAEAIPFITSILDYLFGEGKGISTYNGLNIELPKMSLELNGITTIGSSAFEYLNLESVTIPNSVTSIGDYAFLLNNLTSITIPSSVTTIGTGAFYENDISTINIEGLDDTRFNTVWSGIGFDPLLMPS